MSTNKAIDKKLKSIHYEMRNIVSELEKVRERSLSCEDIGGVFEECILSAYDTIDALEVICHVSSDLEDPNYLRFV